MDYTTQMDAARKGIITREMELVARKEKRTAEEIRQWVAEGRAAIPCNRVHKALDPNGIGSMLKTKINVNLGTSRDCMDLDTEVEKVNRAVAMGAESIMDLSSFGDTRVFRRRLTAECPAIIGTVPIYDAVVYYHKALKEITTEEWLDIVRMHAEDGVDFMTIHCGINRSTAKRFKENRRLTNIVSRGGSIIFAWMEMTGKENPFYEHFDDILEICREYDVTLSLGDACRPGCLKDASDISQIEELVTLGELTRRAWEKDVQVIIEGPGHMPLNQIEANMRIQKESLEFLMKVGKRLNLIIKMDLQGSPVLCSGTAGDRRGPRIRPYYGGHWRSPGSSGRRVLPLLCDSGRAFKASQCGGCKGGDHRVPDRCPCGGYRQGDPVGHGLGQ